MVFPTREIQAVRNKVAEVFPVTMRPTVTAFIDLMASSIEGTNDSAKRCHIEDALSNLLSVEQDKGMLLELAGQAPRPTPILRQFNEEFRALVDDLGGEAVRHLSDTLQSSCQCVNR